MIEMGFIVPTKPHPFLIPDQNPGYQKLKEAYVTSRKAIENSKADLLVLYSTGWPSVIGHQVQARPQAKWVHVDHEWHEYGEIPYDFRMDASFAHELEKRAQRRGLHARCVDYEGFPIDTGSIIALKLLNPDNRIPACILSCNMYADRAETIVLGKAVRDALQASGRRAIAIACTSLSNRHFKNALSPSEDRIYSPKDEEWNQKILEFLSKGRLEDVSQLAREFTHQASGDSKGKALWWLSAVMGQTNQFEGKVHAYAPIWGTGAAVVELTPSDKAAADKEFDEEDIEVFQGSDTVLSTGSVPSASGSPLSPTAPSRSMIRTGKAPNPVGAYPHARREGDLIYVSGISSSND